MQISPSQANFEVTPTSFFFNFNASSGGSLRSCSQGHWWLVIHQCIIGLNDILLVWSYNLNQFGLSHWNDRGKCDYSSQKGLQIWHSQWYDLLWPSDTRIPQIAKFMGPTWGPPGSCRPQMGPMLAPWTLLSGQCPIFYIKLSRYRVPIIKITWLW